MLESDAYDCVVIGAGPGGLVSALYLKRFRRRILVVSGGRPRTKRIPLIRNLVGYSRGISGRNLLARLRRQLRPGVEVVEGQAVVKRRGDEFLTKIAGREIRSRFVILATGVTDLEPPLSNLDQLTRRELLGYCPICDGYEQSNKRIAVIVGGTQCLGKLDFLRQYSRQLVLIKTASFETPTLEGVEVFEGLRWARPHKKGLLMGVGRDEEIFVHIAYAELGTRVNEAAVTELTDLARTSDGFFRVDRHQETSIPGLFAVGDCVHGLSQISVAVGHAAIAATTVHNRLREFTSALRAPGGSRNVSAAVRPSSGPNERLASETIR